MSLCRFLKVPSDNTVYSSSVALFALSFFLTRIVGLGVGTWRILVQSWRIKSVFGSKRFLFLPVYLIQWFWFRKMLLLFHKRR